MGPKSIYFRHKTSSFRNNRFKLLCNHNRFCKSGEIKNIPKDSTKCLVKNCVVERDDVVIESFKNAMLKLPKIEIDNFAKPCEVKVNVITLPSEEDWESVSAVS